MGPASAAVAVGKAARRAASFSTTWWQGSAELIYNSFSWLLVA
ncbi:hypothetical protein [Streptosporangium sandarakinum]|uniref:Uncharacterized protein n=1 Tax=Streptosporangium sandarakinum TaxID=1260955 RepID=A0A852V112_9ACTN|nr:hypothetical protein [Streptosporangium sandarakinum]NYF42169.1 hypothetical protein [Streptosporangium sandarakinum]